MKKLGASSHMPTRFDPPTQAPKGFVLIGVPAATKRGDAQPQHPNPTEEPPVNETALDAAMAGLLALAKRLHPADHCTGVIIAPGQAANTWTCSIRGGATDGTKTVAQSGSGSTPQTAFNDLAKHFHDKIKERQAEDTKALALADKASNLMSQQTRA